MLPQNWIHLLVDVETKDTAKPKSGRKKDLLERMWKLTIEQPS